MTVPHDNHLSLLRPLAAAGLLLLALSGLSGCVAALVPLVAATAIGGSEIDRAQTRKDFLSAGAVNLGTQGRTSGQPAPGFTADMEAIEDAPVGTGAIDLAAIDQPEPLSEESVSAVGIPDRDDGLTGQSGTMDPNDSDNPVRAVFDAYAPALQEASPYAAFTGHALAQAQAFAAGDRLRSVVLQPRFDILRPETISCDGKPLAVLVDLDSDDDASWFDAGELYRQPGLVDMVQRLRAAEISVIWITDAPAQAADRVAAILEAAGLAESDSHDFLFIGRDSEDRKQVRRWEAAKYYCIVAMAGDERSDFDELYDYLLTPDGAVVLEPMFGDGWFITPAPFLPADEGVADAPKQAALPEAAD